MNFNSRDILSLTNCRTYELNPPVGRYNRGLSLINSVVIHKFCGGPLLAASFNVLFSKKETLNMYESHFTCHFFRLWGFFEGRANSQMSEPLLGNMQNPFDALFGDVVGQNDGRFFIIEFKRSRDGFLHEISKNGKEDRLNLYEHLKEDSDCRDLAFAGHFGGYPAESNQLAFEPYTQCMLPHVSRKQQLINAVLSEQLPHPIETRRWEVNFASLYQDLTVSHSYPPVLENGFFSSGLGLTKDQLQKYVACMYQHLESSEDQNGQAMLGRFDAATGKFHAVTKPIPELVQDLHKHFAEMRNALTPQAPAPGQRGLI